MFAGVDPHPALAAYAFDSRPINAALRGIPAPVMDSAPRPLAPPELDEIVVALRRRMRPLDRAVRVFRAVDLRPLLGAREPGQAVGHCLVDQGFMSTGPDAASVERFSHGGQTIVLHAPAGTRALPLPASLVPWRANQQSELVFDVGTTVAFGSVDRNGQPNGIIVDQSSTLL
ncbi:MAG: hypothetical protein AB7O29_10220 [Acidimicrobiia bacterium]